MLYLFIFFINKKQDFNINIIEIKNELKDYSYGLAYDVETVISVYGTITANIQCNKIKIKCDVYSKNNQKICSPTGTYNIKKGETINFNIYTTPKNSGYLDTPLHILNMQIEIVN